MLTIKITRKRFIADKCMISVSGRTKDRIVELSTAMVFLLIVFYMEFDFQVV